MKNVLITGGTGTLGKQVVQFLLKEPDRQIYVLTTQKNRALPPPCRKIIADLATNTGLEALPPAIDVVIHGASNPRNPLEVDVAGTRHLLHALNLKSITHFIYISIVGVDKTDYPYYQAKRKVEQMIAECGVPFSILRTTQFYNLVLHLILSLEQDKDFVFAPSGLRFQAVAVQEVAQRLANLMNEKPAGLLPDMAGPEILPFEEMIDSYWRHQGQTKKIQLLPLKSERYDLFRSGVNLTSTKVKGNSSWQQFLRQTQEAF